MSLFIWGRLKKPQLEQGETGDPPTKCNFTLGVVWRVQGFALPFGSSVPLGLWNVITDSEGAGGSQPTSPDVVVLTYDTN